MRRMLFFALIAILFPGFVVVGVTGELWQKPFQPDENTIALYHFDEGQDSRIADSSKNKNNGKIYGIERKPLPRWVEGKFGNALEFDGLYGWSDIPDREYLVGMDELTIEAWVFVYDPEESCTTARSSSGEIITTPGCSLRMTKNADRFEFVVYTEAAERNNRTVVLSKPIEYEEWHHVAGTYDGHKCRIFVDGDLAGTNETGESEKKIKAVMKGRTPDPQLDCPRILRIYSPVSIGGGVNLLNGIIDEVRISDCVRYEAR